MIHYSVWFNLKSGVEEPAGLAIVQAFLDELCPTGSAAGFQLLQNAGQATKTKLPKFQALIEFHDEAQFAAAFRDQAARGIHAGTHGRMISVVTDFSAEVFKQLAVASAPSVPGPLFVQACEI